MSAECHSHIIKTEFRKIVNATSVEKDLSTFFNKKWIEVYDPSEENYRLNRADYVILVTDTLLVTELLLLLIQMVKKEIKVLHLKTSYHLSAAF